MLYIASVHYKSPRWIDIQARYLQEHISVPYRRWSSIEGIDPVYAARFDRVIEQRGAHAGKLNHLAREICAAAADSDLIMFLDGDAFPIADPMPTIEDALARSSLLAVRRAENADEPHPHPCFCVTTVGTWRSLPGDWSGGYPWSAVYGKLATDVGANLLRGLELSGSSWVSLLRSNGAQSHPLLFAIYGDIVYHHGAGFRDDLVTRADRAMLAASRSDRAGAPHLLRRITARVKGRSWYEDWQRQTKDRNRKQSEAIFEAIERGDPNWLAMVRDGDGVAEATVRR